MYILMVMKAKNKLHCLVLQEAIAYLSLIMLISASVSSVITKKLVGKIGSKVTTLENEKNTPDKINFILLRQKFIICYSWYLET